MKAKEAIEVCEDRIKWCGNYYGEKWKVEKPFLERCLKALRVYDTLTNGEKSGESFTIRNRSTGKEITVDSGVCTLGSGIYTFDEHEIFDGDTVTWKVGDKEDTGIVKYQLGAFWTDDCLLCNRDELRIINQEDEGDRVENEETEIRQN